MRLLGTFLLGTGLVSSVFGGIDVHERFDTVPAKWSAEDGASLVVATNPRKVGERSLAIHSTDQVGSVVRQDSLDPGTNDLWIDFTSRPALFRSGTRPYTANASPTAFFFDDAGHLVVFDGADGRWVEYPLGPNALRPGEWVRISLALNYDLQRWTIWINGKRMAANLGFASPSDRFSRFKVAHRSEQEALLDDLGISFRRPDGLAGDTDFHDTPKQIFMPGLGSADPSKDKKKKRGEMQENEERQPSLFVPLKK